MGKGRGLGLVGGLGVGATVHYYQRLATAHEERGRELDLVIAHAETARVFAYVEADDRDGLAEYLCGFIDRLKAAGAEFAAIPAVTAHFGIRELVAASPLPVFDLFEPVNEEIGRRALRRVAVFGTRYVMDAALFGLLEGTEIIHARPDEVDYIHRTYMELVVQRRGSEQQCSGLTDLAQTLCRRERLDAIVLAGTDFAVLFNGGNTNFPSVDCAALHLRAIVNGLLG